MGIFWDFVFFRFIFLRRDKFIFLLLLFYIKGLFGEVIILFIVGDIFYLCFKGVLVWEELIVVDGRLIELGYNGEFSYVLYFWNCFGDFMFRVYGWLY